MSGPYAQRTGLDHLPMDQFGGGADAGADATDASAEVNINGANDIAANSRAEAAEIAAVPDPQSPAGQAAILAIIEKYQGKSVGTVESSAATEQANGTQAANDNSDKKDDEHDHDDDSDNSSGDGLGGGGSGSLMDILSSLLGSGGSAMQGMSPFGQQGQQGMSPFGDPYGQQSTQPAATSPFADPFAAASATPGASPASYNAAADPFATSPSTGTGTVTASSVDPFATGNGSDQGGGDQSGSDQGGGDQSGGDQGGSDQGGGATSDTGAGASSNGGSGVDVGAFSGADGSSVPADPAAATS